MARQGTERPFLLKLLDKRQTVARLFDHDLVGTPFGALGDDRALEAGIVKPCTVNIEEEEAPGKQPPSGADRPVAGRQVSRGRIPALDHAVEPFPWNGFLESLELFHPEEITARCNRVLHILGGIILRTKMHPFLL